MQKQYILTEEEYIALSDAAVSARAEILYALKLQDETSVKCTLKDIQQKLDKIYDIVNPK